MTDTRSKTPDYILLAKQIEALAEISRDETAVLANASALLYEAMPDVNWAGFYLVREDDPENPGGSSALIVGPFQGKPACVRIERGRGVCGTAWEKGETQLVADVHEFPGHIACDSASNSEIVIPLHRKAQAADSKSGKERGAFPEEHGGIFGVLDIDSPEFGRFTEADAEGLRAFAETLEEILGR